MKYIKNLLGTFVICGVCGWVAGAGTGNVVTILVSTVLVVSCSIGVCIVEEMEESSHGVESMHELPKPKS